MTVSFSTLEKSLSQTKLKVGIGSFGSWMLGVGSIIGSMAWLFHTYMIARAGTLASITAWFIAGILFLPVTFILAELSSMFPTAGGPYVYKYYALKRLFKKEGELFGFMTGWMFWAALIAGYACMSNGFSNILAFQIYGQADKSPIWFSPLCIISLFFTTTLINLLDVSKTSAINTIFTIIKFSMVFIFAALVSLSPNSSITYLLNPANLQGQTDFIANIFSVLALALTGLGGVELVACASSETKQAVKNVPRSMFFTLISIVLIYAGVCASIACATSYVLNADGSKAVVSGTNISATLPEITSLLAGNFWGKIASFAVISSIFGCAIGGMLSTARIAYSMAQTGLFPIQFSKLSKKNLVPSYALIFQFFCLCTVGIIANLLSRFGVVSDAYSFLGETFGFMYQLIVVLYAICFISLRFTDPDMERPFRISPRGNALAWIFSILTICVFGSLACFCTKAIFQIAGLVLTISGLPLYFYFKSSQNKTIEFRI